VTYFTRLLRRVMGLTRALFTLARDSGGYTLARLSDDLSMLVWTAFQFKLI